MPDCFTGGDCPGGAPVDGFTSLCFSSGTMHHQLYVIGDGPPVLLLHELLVCRDDEFACNRGEGTSPPEGDSDPFPRLSARVHDEGTPASCLGKSLHPQTAPTFMQQDTPCSPV